MCLFPRPTAIEAYRGEREHLAGGQSEILFVIGGCGCDQAEALVVCQIAYQRPFTWLCCVV
jgi:hypothetical protein